MYLTIEEAESRLFRTGVIAAAVGAAHIFSLFLTWYVHTAAGLTSEAIQGYRLNEILALSLAGGILGALAAISTNVSKKLKQMKQIEAGLALGGGALAIASPLYMIFLKIPGLGVGYLDVGLFVSLISGGALLMTGLIVLFIPITIETTVAPPGPPGPLYVPPSPQPRPTPSSRSVESPQRQVVMVPVEGVPEGAVCTICYQPLEAVTTVKCGACGSLFHQGCVDVWVELNRICPNCKNPVESAYPTGA